MIRRIKTTEIPESEGKVILTPDEGRGGLCVFREAGDQFTILSAKCPHKFCDVKWNAGDKTWLCPCHGAKFDPYGKLIRGPAESDLRKLEAKLDGDEIVVEGG